MDIFNNSKLEFVCSSEITPDSFGSCVLGSGVYRRSPWAFNLYHIKLNCIELTKISLMNRHKQKISINYEYKKLSMKTNIALSISIKNSKTLKCDSNDKICTMKKS